MNELDWQYNCLDCTYTRECGETELETLAAMGLAEVDAFQQRMFWPVLEAMKRGIRIDEARRKSFSDTLFAEIAKREEYFQFILGHPFNPRSPPQMVKLFYEDFNQQPIRAKAKGGVPGNLTCDDEALTKIGQREPLLLPLLRAIQEYRTLGVFLSTFIAAPLDTDHRMRCSYNLCGTETYRLNSSENAFGSGTNLQNIPRKKGDDSDEGELRLDLPDVRQIYIPDSGFTMFDTDLSKADLRIVTHESDAKTMKAMFREGRDPYIEAAREFHHDPSISKYLPSGLENKKYDDMKKLCHGSNYLGTPVGLAARIGLTVHETEKTQRWYFGKHPEIPAWQKRVIEQVKRHHFVSNAFGFRRYYFDRIDESTFRKAVAWIGQSTTAIYINKIWLNIFERFPEIAILLQVHDSLVGQFPTHLKQECLINLSEAAKVVIPYEDPLVIPVGIKTSDVSWGDCSA